MVANHNLQHGLLWDRQLAFRFLGVQWLTQSLSDRIQVAIDLLCLRTQFAT